MMSIEKETITATPTRAGKWCYFLDADNYLSIVLTSASFPDSSVSELISEIFSEFRRSNDIHIRPTATTVESQFLKRVGEKYADPTPATATTRGLEDGGVIVVVEDINTRAEEEVKEAVADFRRPVLAFPDISI